MYQRKPPGNGAESGVAGISRKPPRSGFNTARLTAVTQFKSGFVLDGNEVLAGTKQLGWNRVYYVPCISDDARDFFYQHHLYGNKEGETS